MGESESESVAGELDIKDSVARPPRGSMQTIGYPSKSQAPMLGLSGVPWGVEDNECCRDHTM